jgi:hypothetical protein
MALKIGIDSYNEGKKKRKPYSTNPKENYPEEWARLQKEGYIAEYMTPEGMKQELVDITKPPCPDSKEMPDCMILRGCNLSHYEVQTSTGSSKTVPRQCPPRACWLHFDECELRGGKK